MATSDWITIISLLVPMLVGFGILWNKLDSLEARVTSLEKTMKRVLRILGGHRYKIKDHEKRLRKLESRS